MGARGVRVPSVVIVGGGGSGTLLAVHLLRQARGPLEVVMVEPRRPGRGVAYDAPHHEHLLNVPAGRMSALAEEPDHFTSWLLRTGALVAADSFVPRHLYGLYLGATLDEARRSAPPGVLFRRSAQQVADVAIAGEGAAVRLADGEVLLTDRVALALGNLPGPGPLPDLLGDPRYVHDPWADGALLSTADEPLLVLGSGLTMVDVALGLVARGRRAPIRAVSRRGLWPQAHLLAPGAPVLAPKPLGREATVLDWLHSVRTQAETARGLGTDWRGVVDALRGITVEIWTGLADAERRRFLRHLRPYWEAHRHRMAPRVARTIDELRRSGRLTVEAARVTATPRDEGLEVTLRPRRGGPSERLLVQRIINATGMEMDVTTATSSLLRKLLAAGLVRPDPLRLGLDATAYGALRDAAGRASPVLFTLGPPLRGLLWESTAVREIRQQAEALCRSWLETLPGETADEVSASRQATG
jgi:uncharacterized NAD(P)/FAD-binding protein YdhS